MKKENALPIFLTLLYYLVFLFLYLQGEIDEFAYVFILVCSTLILLISLIFFRKKPAVKKKISIAAFILFLAFCYEFILVGYDAPTHVAYAYIKPEEAVEGSGIFIVGVSEIQVGNTRSKQEVINLLTRKNEQVFSVVDVNHYTVYGVKNRQLLKWILFRKDPLEEMKTNVIDYLGKEEEWLTRFVNKNDIQGSSAGLSLALTGRLEKGDYKNDLGFAVTEAITKTGKVKSISGIKEKIQIAEKTGFPFMIIPSENAKEAAKVQKELNSTIKIYTVSTVDEAIEVIVDLNKRIIK
ncbi:hypothetical protein A8F94_22660 [Bacillus sp. FJAT-27225]|uniref:S16 family serine protease n=1 Tax=Bacillus sp. FJAT-27225 TaxID=1743144 RepID=UPI00080C240D|nr:S16 family serine protease [Bacillus sp. FJAT-27225]OCA81663.1 hypothetical protein A8F94_22660 [Bacillus sp. FJAT-27225]